jgi:hypothetical protein
MPMVQSRVEALHQRIDTDRPMQSLTEALLLPDFGMQGDFFAAPGRRRQLLLSRQDVLRELRLAPGRAGDHITLSGIKIDLLPEGTRIAIGEAVVELTDPLEPDERLESIRQGLHEALKGRMVWARVVSGGRVRPGDRIDLLLD